MKITIFSVSILAAFILIYGDVSGQTAQGNGNTHSGSKIGIEAADSKAPGNQPNTDKSKIHSVNGRGCAPVYRSNPYAISRKDFEQLPPDRQKFVLNHPDKYPITD
jgi:hypothetical protein